MKIALEFFICHLPILIVLGLVFGGQVTLVCYLIWLTLKFMGLV